MTWAEILTLLIYLLVMMFWGFIAITGGGTNPWPMLFYLTWISALVVALPVWIVLRLIDALFGGPARRAGVVTGRWV